MNDRINIKNPVAREIAGAIAARTGQTLTQVVLEALRAQYTKLVPDHDTDSLDRHGK